MDLKTIHLPAITLAELYRTSLVIPGAETVKETGTAPIIERVTEKETITEKEADWSSLGNNRKNISVIVDYAGGADIPGNEMQFLNGILSACKLSLDDITLINLGLRPGVTYKQIIEQFRSKIILLFDVSPEKLSLPLSFPAFQPQAFNRVTYLYVPSLADLVDDKLLKSKLWVSLKNIFEV
jgi:hypothetical protein